MRMKILKIMAPWLILLLLCLASDPLHCSSTALSGGSYRTNFIDTGPTWINYLTWNPSKQGSQPWGFTYCRPLRAAGPIRGDAVVSPAQPLIGKEAAKMSDGDEVAAKREWSARTASVTFSKRRRIPWPRLIIAHDTLRLRRAVGLSRYNVISLPMVKHF